MFKALLVFSLIFAQSSFAAGTGSYCLRHPDVSFSVFERNLQACRALSELATEIADTQLDSALTKATLAIDRHPERAQKIWNSFWQQMRLKIWSPEHAAVARELRIKLGMEDREDFSSTFGAEGDLKKSENIFFSSVAGWEDALLFRDGQPYFGNKDDDSDEYQWMIYSSMFSPDIFYGSFKEFQKHWKSAKAIPWIAHDCSAKTSLHSSLATVSVRTVLANHCKEFKPDFRFLPSAPTVSFPARVQIEQRNLVLGALGLAIVGGIAYALKDKKVVIRR